MNNIYKFLPVTAALVLTSFGANAEDVDLKQVNTYKTTTTAVSAPQTRAEETWKDIGEGLWRDDTLFANYIFQSVPEFPVTLQESEQTPGRYRIVNPYSQFNRDYLYGTYLLDGDWYVVIDASDPEHVYIECSRTGYVIGHTEGRHQQHMIWSVADDYYNNRYGDWELADIQNMVGKLVDNVISFPPSSVLSSADFIDNPGDDFIWARNPTDQFRVKLPTALDLDVNIRLAVYDEEKNVLVYEITPQDDVTSLKIALLPGDYDAETPEKIADGTIESTVVTEFGDVEVPFVGDGVYTLYAVPVVDGVAKPYFSSYLTRELNYDQSEWRKCGYARYTEAILSSNDLNAYGFTIPAHEYDVLVEQNVKDPAQVRLVDPYCAGYPEATSTNYDYTRHYYIELDIDDPEAVWMKRTCIGIDFGYGKHIVWSRVGRYYDQGLTKEEIREKETTGDYPDGPIFGTHKDNVISFPENALLVVFPAAVPTPYWANHNGNWKLVLKDGQLVPTTGVTLPETDASDAMPRYFNLQGVEVSGSNLAPGIYIVRQGNTTSKIVVR